MDIIKAIEEAIEEEKAGIRRYKQMAEQAGDPESKAVFGAMARDEENHYRALKERLTAIKLRRQKIQ
ncbi:MAG: ferritin family protein [Deltaproteobacteria bacterium]|jgi:rubrerythrin